MNKKIASEASPEDIHRKDGVIPGSIHRCSPQFEPPCWFKDEETGKDRISEEHWNWLTDKGPAGQWHNLWGPSQKDCKPGDLQEDGSRKIVTFLDEK